MMTSIIRHTFLSLCLCVVITGACTNAAIAAKPDKVVALIALDTEPGISEGRAIKKGGEVVSNILALYCKGKYEQSNFNVNRSQYSMPKDILTKISELKTDENSILFLYLCSHGTYHNNERYVFVLNDNVGGPAHGLKRADIVAALKKKKHHSIVFISDACSLESKKPIAEAYATPNARFFDFLAKQPKGTFLDINTSSKGQISYCSSGTGGYGTWTFKETIQDYVVPSPNISWGIFQERWQERLSDFKAYRYGQLVRGKQDLDVKIHKP